jgi:hypothetical protein
LASTRAEPKVGICQPNPISNPVGFLSGFVGLPIQALVVFARACGSGVIVPPHARSRLTSSTAASNASMAVVSVGELYTGLRFLVWSEWLRMIRHPGDIRPAVRVLKSQPG